MNLLELLTCIGVSLVLTGAAAHLGAGASAALTHAAQHWASAITSAGGQ